MKGVGVGVGTHATEHVQRPVDSSVESLLSYMYVESGS